MCLAPVASDLGTLLKLTKFGGGVQIQLPWQLSGPLGSAESGLQRVIRSCLRSRPWERPTAKQVEADLQAIMQQQGWSNNLLDTSGQPTKLIKPL